MHKLDYSALSADDRKVAYHLHRVLLIVYSVALVLLGAFATIVHDPEILKWLASRVSVDRIVLGSDYSFPPADRDPVGTVRRAGFSPAA